MHHGRTRGRALPGLAITAALAALAGCAPTEARILSLTGSEIDDPPCALIRDIPVEELGDPAREPCVPNGSTLVFPAGERLEVSGGTGGGTSTADPDAWVAYSTVGDYGVIAGRYGPGCTDVTTWGPESAIEKVRAAFGQQWPCDP